MALLSPLRLGAQDADSLNAAAQQFSFDTLTEDMRALAAQPWLAAPAIGGPLAGLDYDQYRLIRYRADRILWQDPGSAWGLAAFPMGWLFKEPVLLFEVTDGLAHEIRIPPDNFEYLNDLASRLPPDTEMPGVAGFRLHHPLNRPDVMDEVVAFVGASYFRALGQDSSYGISARGLALNTVTARGEEFPRFSRFYIDRSAQPGSVTIYAALQSPSVTGAYRMVLTPGATTTMEVTARLFFRRDVEELGIAPLTSMYLFAGKDHNRFDDFRPNVHDSDGLRIVRADGDIIWRPLNNPPRLSGSYFPEQSPRRFGLHQRERRFDSYLDTEALYHHRPSLDIEPLGDWGKGFVRLVEIPSDLEANDNIVAYWVPEQKARAGESREYSYRLHWGHLPVDPAQVQAHVVQTRAGHGGFSGGPGTDGLRKFVIEFKGGWLDRLPRDADMSAVVAVENGKLVANVLQYVAENDTWRLVIDVTADSGAVVEISAHLAGHGRRLTENWLYQWINAT